MLYIYMLTFTINISPMLAYIPYMDPMGYVSHVTSEHFAGHLAGHLRLRYHPNVEFVFSIVQEVKNPETPGENPIIPWWISMVPIQFPIN